MSTMFLQKDYAVLKANPVKPQSPLTFRLEPELHKRLEKCASETRLKKYALAILAIEAAVEAIEKNEYRLVVPIKFEVAQVPQPSTTKNLSDSSYPTHREGTAVAEERFEPKRKKAN